jgi:hypothetical protein
MFTLSGLFIGLAMIGLGVLGVKYTFWLTQTTGPLNFIEKYTGSGSTYGIYKIFSLLLIFVGFFWATGFGHSVLDFILSPIIGVFRPQQ